MPGMEMPDESRAEDLEDCMSARKRTVARETIAVSGREPGKSIWRPHFPGALVGLTALAILFSPSAAQAQVSMSSLGTPRVHTPAKVLNGTATFVKHYDPAQMLRLAIVLTPPHLAEERQFLEDVQNKNSPLFHQFLTSDEWNARFAPAAEDEQAVADWAQSQGFTLTRRYPNRLVVDVEAPAGTIEKAFGVTINNYQVGPDLLYSNDRDPVLPHPAIDSVLGLNSIEHQLPLGGAGPYVPRPDYVPGPPIQVLDSAQGDASPDATAASGDASDVTNVTAPKSGYYTPASMFSSSAYNYGALGNQGHCCNPTNNPGYSPAQTSIAIAAYGDVSLTDVSNFVAYFSYLSYNVQKFAVDGGYTCGNNDNNCGEVTMDTEWSLSMANGSSASSTARVYVYEGPNSNQQSIVDVTNSILTTSLARVMSTSWGGQEAALGTDEMNAIDYVYSQMAGQGWTLVAASGDQGATAGCGDAIAVQFPASDPNVVGVGGTQLSESSGQNYEVAWTGGTSAGSCAANNGGGTGGISNYYHAPAYQSSFNSGNRTVPDMALDSFYGHDVFLNGAWAYLAGTSVAAPMLAGFFAQENAYLLSIGNKCGSGTSPCAPMGNANYPIYQEGFENNAGRNPFYDVVLGCNSNDITIQYNLAPQCAATGFDFVTGFGSANMLQLAWAINWELTAATGIPSIKFSGPPTNKWYNSNQTVNWTVVDYAGGGGAPGTGIAGETQGWDSIPADPGSEPHGGSGNSFYTGPQFPNGSTGCLAFEANGCSGGVSQGCHVVHVEGWNNQGLSTGDTTYGPICYDTVPPTVSSSASPAPNSDGWNRQSVTVTLTASDAGGSGASGIKTSYYAFNGTCSTTSLSSCQTYGAPLVVSQQGYNLGSYFTEDNAGNFSSVHLIGVNIDETPPVTTATLAGTVSGNNYTSAVTVTLSATDSLSGVASTTYSLDGAGVTTYTGPFTVATPGTHTLQFYSTDLAGNVETTHTTSFTIVSPTTTAVTSSSNPSVYGHAVTFTAKVTATLGSAPTGKVTFMDGTAKLGTGTLSGGAATFSTSTLLNGIHTITVSYGGSSTDLSSTSGTLVQTVQDTTAIALTSSLNPSIYGQSVTLTAIVTATHAGTVTGTVTFMDGTTALGTGTINTAGKVTFSTGTFAAGSHSLTGVYGGDGLDAGSTSATLTQTVNKDTTTTTLTSSLNPSVYGQSVTLTATVTAKHGVSTSGTVTFMDGTTTLGTATIGSANQATLATSTLGAGSHSLTAAYGGSANDAAGTSAALTQTVTQATSTTSLGSSVNPSTYGQAVGFTATITSAHGGPVNGSVTFKDGTTTLATATVDSATNQAGFSTTTLAPGTHTLTAVYGGSTNDAASTSGTFTQTVLDATSTTLASSLNPSVFGQSVTLTAVVTPLHGGSVSGTVTFYNGTGTFSALGVGTLGSANTATLTVSTLLPGSHALTAVYSGSATDAVSGSPVLTQTVKDETTTVLTSSVNPSAIGETVTLTAAITPAHGGTVSGSVTFKDGTTTLGIVLIENVNKAAFSTSTLAAGSHSLTAVYGGGTSDGSSTSAVLKQTVE